MNWRNYGFYGNGTRRGDIGCYEENVFGVMYEI